ncbi:solute carrier family 22 member 15-like [Homarus americanus]|uniref:Solute carrier family 22 member 15-like 3 n=1 Tax=Homarus americanus TaxID=6706 RepID=A0A8J5K125_HOMAM|nr:solute carrier family 22 member 15-like [Homarus americanus]KAG7165543.1 Solute carrier family 22 member 15-like 3 [Homarus americanus]
MLRRISLIMYFNWLTCTLVYYGISLNSANFNMDPFLYMFLGGLMELPSYTLIIPFVARYGRKIPLVTFFVLCGVAILVLLLLPADRERWWFMTIVMVGKFFITSAYQVVYLYSSELYPTCLRTQGLGVSSMVGRIGSIISPFINDMLGLYHWAIPSTIFGLASLVAGGLTCLLPETKDKTLPDTVDDVEAWRSPALSKRERPRDVAASEEDQREESWLNPSTTSV